MLPFQKTTVKSILLASVLKMEDWKPLGKNRDLSKLFSLVMKKFLNGITEWLNGSLFYDFAGSFIEMFFKISNNRQNQVDDDDY